LELSAAGLNGKISYEDNGFQHIVGLEWRRGDEWSQKDAMKLLVSILST
jgi:hypothetical protein